MSFAWETDKGMYFVGGLGPKSGNGASGTDFQGGCTKAWWDTEVAANGAASAMGKLMAANGDAVCVTSDTAHVDSVGYVCIYDTAGNSFAGAEVGMLLYHPNLEGGGVFEIIEQQDSGPSYVVLDSPWTGSESGYDGDTVYVGGAWSSVNVLAKNISSAAHTQEILCNKDQDISAAVDMSYWGDGDSTEDTWLIVSGFNYLPGDMLFGGGYYQGIGAIYGGDAVAAASYACFDGGGGSFNLIDKGTAENVIFKGFQFKNVSAAASYTLIFGNEASGNIIFDHCVFEPTANVAVSLSSTTFAALIDCFVGAFANVSIYFASGTLAIIGSIIRQTTTGQIGLIVSTGGVCFPASSIIEGNQASMQAAGMIVSVNNTIRGVSTGGARVKGPGFLFSNNDIITTPAADVPAVLFAVVQSSAYIDNLCAYSDEGALDDVVDGLAASGEYFLGDNIIEVDPLLDSENEPLEEQVRTGGMPDVLGDPTSLGAIQTMNTGVINTAVQAALTSQGYTAGRAPYLDTLASGVKLAADGLDDVVVAEPTGDPAAWSFVKCLRWLIMRFMNKHTSDNFDGLKVYKADDTLSTTQTVSEAVGVKTVTRVNP